MKSAHVLLLSAATAVYGAVNLDSARVVEPLIGDDPSPIADLLTYIPEQYDYPLPYYINYVNVYKWTPYYTVDRLQHYQLPILLHFSVMLALDDPNTDVLIQSYTPGTNPASSSDRTVNNATSIPIDNPKLGPSLFEPSVDVAPACAFISFESSLRT
jgi:hypothetical protein